MKREAAAVIAALDEGLKKKRTRLHASSPGHSARRTIVQRNRQTYRSCSLGPTCRSVQQSYRGAVKVLAVLGVSAHTEDLIVPDAIVRRGVVVE